MRPSDNFWLLSTLRPMNSLLMFPEAGNRVDNGPVTSSDYVIRNVSKTNTLNPLNSLNRTKPRVSLSGIGEKRTDLSLSRGLMLGYVMFLFISDIDFFNSNRKKKNQPKKETIKK